MGEMWGVVGIGSGIVMKAATPLAKVREKV
jgi:hypothetical protein